MTRLLFVSSMHHPEALRAAQADAVAKGEQVPLFPPSMSQHFWEKALRKRGFTLDVFFRNQPALGPGAHSTARHTQTITPGKVFSALMNRIPPLANPDIRLRNARLLEKAEAFQPDVLWMHGDNTVIYPQTLARIKAMGVRLLYSCGTSPIVFTHAIDRAAGRLYDLVLANDYYHGVQWLELGAKRMECLPLSACDPDFHHPYALTDAERSQYACEIAFVGTLVPDNLYSRRVRALEALGEFDLGIWSVHEVPPSLKQYVRGQALGEEMEKIISAGKLCCNTHGDFMHYGGNLRLFEVAGAGVAQISDDLPGTRIWFPEIDGKPTLLTYTGNDDLRAKVRRLLNDDNEREAMAQRAREHVYNHHTYDHRAARVEALIGEL